MQQNATQTVLGMNKMLSRWLGLCWKPDHRSAVNSSLSSITVLTSAERMMPAKLLLLQAAFLTLAVSVMAVDMEKRWCCITEMPHDMNGYEACKGFVHITRQPDEASAQGRTQACA
jgi:hypothetical protein